MHCANCGSDQHCREYTLVRTSLLGKMHAVVFCLCMFCERVVSVEHVWAWHNRGDFNKEKNHEAT